MSGIRYTEEFKRDAVSQVKDRGYSVNEVSERLGISTKSLYGWVRQYHKPAPFIQKDSEQAAEIRRLKAELARVKEERDILKKATAYFARDAD
jgi:transposase